MNPARASRPSKDAPAAPLRVGQVGLGAIGRGCCRLAARKRSLALVGAADISPDIRGCDLSSLIGAGLPHPLRVHGSIRDLIRESRPEVILHTTGSRSPAVLPQLEEILSHGVSCVTSAEEILLTDLRHPEVAEKLRDAAGRHRAALVGTGVNPGFVMDLLAALLTGTCEGVESIAAGRKVDLATRRPALQRKAGVGMSAEEFREKVSAGRMGHVGLVESGAIVCRCLGWDPSELAERIDPIIAHREVRVGDLRVPAGRVLGLHHLVSLERDGRERLRLDLQMILGAEDPTDWVEIQGEPDLSFRIPGGIPGDRATAAILVHTAPAIAAAPPGLHTILDLPPVRFIP